MTPEQFRQARQTLGLSAAKMGLMLGYTGTSAGRMVRHMESGDRAIREAQIRLVEAYLAGYRPPDWPG